MHRPLNRRELLKGALGVVAVGTLARLSLGGAAEAAQGLVMAGGVSANRKLRARVDSLMADLGGRAYYPRAELCTDNGAMIAYAGWQRLRAGQHDCMAFGIRPRWPMVELPAV